MGVWQKYQIKDNQTVGVQTGPLRLWVRRVGDEWLIGHRYDELVDDLLTGYDKTPQMIEECPDDLDWRRWAVGRNEDEVDIKPIMPKHPVVARPTTALQLSPGRSARVYIRIPVWVQIKVGSGKDEAVLCEIPSVELSNTWFGDPVSGELCYSLSTRAVRELPLQPLDPHRAICSVLIKNASSHDELTFNSVCIRAPHLSVYESGDRLWANDVSVRFKDYSRVSDVRYSTRPPKTADGKITRLADPRTPHSKNLLKRSFSNFQSWTQG